MVLQWASMLATGLLFVTVALPPWSVGTDGRTCVLIDDPLAATLEAWVEDPTKSAPEDGIWARYNPDAPRQIVLLFDSEQTCQAAVGLLSQKPVEKQLRKSAVRKELETFIRADKERAAVWRVLTATQRKRLAAEIETAFAGNVEREKLAETLEHLSVHRRRSPGVPRTKQGRLERLRLEAYEHLFQVVFGERHGQVRPAP
jgi:hypothetical protein